MNGRATWAERLGVLGTMCFVVGFIGTISLVGDGHDYVFKHGVLGWIFGLLCIVPPVTFCVWMLSFLVRFVVTGRWPE